MAQKGSDDLFRLIHSLTSEEKGYFMKFARRHTTEGNKYLKLFDLINRQKSFDEKLLKKNFKDYAVWKVYLFDTILKSLLVHKNHLDEQAHILREMILAYILEQKGLFNSARQRIEKVQIIAQQNEFFWLQDHLMRMHYNVSKFGRSHKENKEENSRINEAIVELRNKAANRDFFMIENWKLTFWQSDKLLDKEQPREEIEEVINVPLLKDDTSALSIGAERLRLTTLSQYYMSKNDYQNTYLVCSKCFAFEKNLFDKNLVGASHAYYLKAVMQSIIACMGTGRVAEAEAYLDKHWKIPEGNERERLNNFYRYVYYKSQFYWHCGQHQQGEKFMKQNIGQILNKRNSERNMDLILEIMKFRILLHFSNKQYREAVMAIDEFESLNIKKTAYRYYYSCEFMRVLIQAELENFDLVKTLVSNMMKRDKEHIITAEEGEFLLFLKKMDNNNRRNLYREMYSFFSAEDKLRKLVLFKGFDLLRWLNNKVTGKPLFEIQREEALKPL